MKVIFCNDDFGLTYGFTEAIKDTFLKGLTTSASVCINGAAYPYAVKLLHSSLKDLCVGIHLNLNYGTTTTKGLQNKDGKYKFSFIKYFTLLQYQNKTLLKDIEIDLDCQFKKALGDNLKIKFVNGHDHIYMIPQIFEIVCKLCRKHEIKYIRLPREPYYFTGNIKLDIKTIFSSNILKFLLLNKFSKNNFNLIKKYNLKTTDSFYGVLHTQHMDICTIKGAVINAMKNSFEKIEILGHPSYINDSRDKNYASVLYENFAKAKERSIEVRAFESQQLKHFLKQNNITLTSYN